MQKGHHASGTVEGTGAAINVSIGFKPARVRVLNIDGLATLEWTKSMPAASGLKEVTAGTKSFITSLGISEYDGVAAGATAGFTIGADTDVNVSAETIHWFAEADE